MTNHQVELSVIKKMIVSSPYSLPGLPIDIALDEDGSWTLITYREDLSKFPGSETTPYLKWLLDTASQAEKKYGLRIRLVRL